MKNRPDYLIRDAKTEDYPAMVKLFQEFANFIGYGDKMTNTPQRMEKEKEYFSSFVVESAEGEIIGYTTFFFCYFTWTGKCLYLDDLYIKETFRGLGIGKELLLKVKDIAVAHDCQRMRWQVSEWNQRAIDFYQSLGAIIDNTEQNCDLVLRK